MVNTETPTPIEVVNKMLDLVPEKVWLDDNAKILCPSCKDGIFLREVAIRILEAKFNQLGGEKFLATKDKILEHILKNRLFGIAISYRGYRVARRTLYDCTGKFQKIDNIYFNEKLAEFVVDKSGQQTEKQAFHFIKNQKEIEKFFASKGVKNMKFDVIIGNPPYQIGDGSGASSDAAMPLYNQFIEEAKKINPQYLVMIVPSKWMVGGRGLQKFRENMKKDCHFKVIYDFENADFCFPDVHIDGGICYFLWNINYSGETKYIYTSNDNEVKETNRFLKNDFTDFIIRDYRIISILEKIKKKEKKMFSEIVSSTCPFGIRKGLFNSPNDYPKAKLSEKPFKNSVKIFGVKGIKGGAKRITGYISKQAVLSNQLDIDKFKLFFTTSYSTDAVIPPDIIVAGKNEVCTETFLQVGPFSSKKERDNCYAFMHTNFFRFLLHFGKGTMQVTKKVFCFIPLLDFRCEWNDKNLKSHFDLSNDEQNFVDSLFSNREIID